MNKQTKTIVIVVVAILVVGGVYYGVNRWRQQRLVNQYLKGLYGADAGLLSKVTGGVMGGGVANQIAQELAKEEAQQKKDEANEAAKTPEDKYNEAEEMKTYDANSKAVADEAKSIMEKAFGKAKLTSISTGLYMGGANGSGIMEFKIARLTTGDDLAAVNKALADKGLPVVQSGVDNKTAGVMAGTNEAAYTVSFEIGGQDVAVSIIKIAQ